MVAWHIPDENDDCQVAGLRFRIFRGRGSHNGRQKRDLKLPVFGEVVTGVHRALMKKTSVSSNLPVSYYCSINYSCSRLWLEFPF